MLSVFSASASTAENDNELPLFVITTPSPITDYSTISNAHIRILESVFLQLGHKLEMKLVLAETTRKQFQGERYDGSIFIEDKSDNEDGLRIEKPLEYVYFDMFCLMEVCPEFRQAMVPPNTVIAATGLGSILIDRHFSEKQFEIVKANHPEHLLRLVKSGRAQLGLTGRPLLYSKLAFDDNDQKLFDVLEGNSLKRGLYLHLSGDDVEFKTKLEQLLDEFYYPQAAKISNNR